MSSEWVEIQVVELGGPQLIDYPKIKGITLPDLVQIEGSELKLILKTLIKNIETSLEN